MRTLEATQLTCCRTRNSLAASAALLSPRSSRIGTGRLRPRGLEVAAASSNTDGWDSQSPGSRGRRGVGMLSCRPWVASKRMLGGKQAVRSWAAVRQGPCQWVRDPGVGLLNPVAWGHRNEVARIYLALCSSKSPKRRRDVGSKLPSQPWQRLRLRLLQLLLRRGPAQAGHVVVGMHLALGRNLKRTGLTQTDGALGSASAAGW